MAAKLDVRRNHTVFGMLRTPSDEQAERGVTVSCSPQSPGLSVLAIICVLLTYLPPTPAAELSVVGDFFGIYVAAAPLFSAKRLHDETIYQAAPATGVYIRLVWSQIERKRGHYDYRLLDTALDRAVANGMRVSLSIIAGGYAPEWLVGEGIRTLQFKTPRGGLKSRSCIVIEMGVPWDRKYQAVYVELWRAIAGHIREKPGAWEALRIVKLTGINTITEELRLPATSGGSLSVCGTTDDTATWLAAGYRPQLIVDAWARMARDIGEAFPGKLLGLDILERNDFPPLDDSGAFTPSPPVKERIISEGLRLFPGRFAVQWNGLNSGGTISKSVLAAGQRGATIGWQSNEFRGFEGAGCNATRADLPLACDSKGYAAILQRGIDTGAAFIEVWQADALRFADEVRAAEKALRKRVRE